MNVNGIGKQPCYEKTNGIGKNERKRDGGFSKSLSENLNGRTGSDSIREETGSPAGARVNAAYSYRNVVTAAGVRESGIAREAEISGADMQEAGPQAAKGCEVRAAGSWKSDYAKACVEQGFSLLAKVDVKGRSVYVEQKAEDGSVKGYEVEIDRVDPNTNDPIERMALEAWEKNAAGKDSTEEAETLTMEEALLQFYEFIEDRIKNGPPKYMIGNSEFSVEEWDKLLEDFDDQLDALREEMRERIAKLREQQTQTETVQELEGKREELQDAEKEDTEEKLLTALFQDKGK